MSDQIPVDQEKKDMRALIGGVHYNACRPRPDATGMYCQLRAMADECEEVIPELKHCRPNFPPGFYRPPRQIDARAMGFIVLVCVTLGFIVGVIVGAR